MACDQDLVPDSNSKLSLLTVPLDACLKGGSQTALADRITFEKMLGEDSDFFPYLELLPPPLEDAQSSLLEMPRFWSDARLSSISNFDGGQLEEQLVVQLGGGAMAWEKVLEVAEQEFETYAEKILHRECSLLQAVNEILTKTPI